MKSSYSLFRLGGYEFILVDTSSGQETYQVYALSPVYYLGTLIYPLMDGTEGRLCFRHTGTTLECNRSSYGVQGGGKIDGNFRRLGLEKAVALIDSYIYGNPEVYADLPSEELG